jgi:hypothetical protein
MRLTIEMHDPQGQILEELTWKGITQDSVALTYAFIIAQCGDAADWPKINAAIRAKWKGKTALMRVKEMAWKQVGAWQGERAEGRTS